MRIGIISDSPALTTGYGIETRHLCNELHKMGADIVCLGLHQRLSGPEKELPYKVVVPHAGSGPGFSSIDAYLVDNKPDVLLVDHSLPTCRLVLDAVRDSGVHVPSIAWYTMEGTPPYKEWLRAVILADRAISHNRTGALEAARLTNVPVVWIPAAVDHTVFHPRPQKERDRIRDLMGWSDKFVVMFLGKNMWSKQQAILLEALALLKKRVERDILFYLHCKPFEQFREGGWDLNDLAERLGVTTRVQFPTGLTNQRRGLPVIGTEQLPGIAERYAAADIFCSASAVEGFGLAILEAMSSGLPVVHPDDNGAMNEMADDAGWRLSIHDRYPISWGSYYVKLSPRIIARGIREVRAHIEDESNLEAWRTKLRRRAAAYQWPEVARALLREMQRLLRKGNKEGWQRG